MDKENLLQSLDKFGYKKVTKLANKMLDQVGKLHDENESMGLVFVIAMADYAKGYIDTFLENNNIPPEIWQEFSDKLTNFNLEDFLENADPSQLIELKEMQIEGWGFTVIENPNEKAHYFTKNRHSLCGKYIWLESEESLELEDGIETLDDCPECRKILNLAVLSEGVHDETEKG